METSRMEVSHIEVNLKSLMGSMEIFQGLTDVELTDIIRISRRREYSPAEIIFDMGEPGDAMYVIESGRVRIVQIFSDGSREILANLDPGQVLGDMSVIDGLPRTARAIAVSTVVVYRLERQEFNVMRNAGNSAAFKIIRNVAKALSKRLRDANKKLIQFYGDPEGSLDYLQARRPRLN